MPKSTYFPQSQTVILHSAGGEFVFKQNPKKEYKGDYVAYSDGRYFIGKYPSDRSVEIIIKPKTTRNQSKIRRAKMYNQLNPKVSSNLAGFRDYTTSKPQPTERNYEEGFFWRYFIKRVNHKAGYSECSIENFNLIKQKQRYDYYLHTAGKIKWALTGEAIKFNQLNIKKLEQRWPYLNTIFFVYDEYFKVLEETPPQNNLYTEGGELYYSDGQEYIGYYHIHPEKGPMEGPEHVDLPHATLYYIKLEEENPNYTPTLWANPRGETTSPTSSTTPTTPTEGELPEEPTVYGGGGYGYSDPTLPVSTNDTTRYACCIPINQYGAATPNYDPSCYSDPMCQCDPSMC